MSANKRDDLRELLSNPEALRRAKAEHQADYMRQYRLEHPNVVETNRAQLRARGKALRRLAELHPEEFNGIYTEERAKEGLGPVRSKKED